MKLRQGYRTITPYLVVPDAEKQIAFLQQVFGGDVTLKSERPDGTVQHAEVRIGDSMVMLGQAGGPWEPMRANLMVYVEDTDETYRKAMAGGAKSLRQPVNESYGDRSAGVEDPCGNVWWIGTPLTESYTS
jgi:uncharacterized glyoxalase superfamily protein PhnB